MEAVKDHTWKELIEQAEIAEKLAKKFEPSLSKNKWVSTQRGVMRPNFLNQKGKKPWSLSYQGQLNPSRKEVQVAIKYSNSRQRSIPSKTSR